MHIHKTKLVTTRAYVDRNIAPLIEWLSSYKSVSTLYSCEGFTRNQFIAMQHDEYEEGSSASAYITFTANQKDLKSILSYVRKFIRKFNIAIDVEVDDYDPRMPIRYCIRFNNQDIMRKFTRFVLSEVKRKVRHNQQESCIV